MSDIDPAVAFIDAVRNGRAEDAQVLVGSHPTLASARDPSGVSAIALALYHGHSGLARWLASQRTDLDIFEAASLGHRERVAALLNSDRSLASAYSPDGFAAVALAAFFGHLAVVTLLLDAGADVNAAGRGEGKYTALTGAVTGRHTDVVAVLLDRGADPNYRYGPGYTPLHAAAGAGAAAIVRLLIGAGASVEARTEAGQRPRDLASENGHGEVVALLDEASSGMAIPH